MRIKVYNLLHNGRSVLMTPDALKAKIFFGALVNSEWTYISYDTEIENILKGYLSRKCYGIYWYVPFGLRFDRPVLIDELRGLLSKLKDYALFIHMFNPVLDSLSFAVSSAFLAKSKILSTVSRSLGCPVL